MFTNRESVRNVIQAKRYSKEHTVGISAVQDVFSCMRYYKARKAIVIAITRFTESCETLAGINHVKLIDRNDLINVIEAFRKGNTIESQEIIECEPRMILGSWSEAHSSTLLEFKKIIKQKNM